MLAFCFVGRETTEAIKKNFEFLEIVNDILIKRPIPTWTNKHTIITELDTLILRDFSTKEDKKGIYILILAPFAGHTSQIADFDYEQSLVEALQQHGVDNVAVTDWKCATQQIKDYGIDNYLQSVDQYVDVLGGITNVVGLCRGMWLGVMYAARHPDKVYCLTLAGSPIDTDAGNGQIKRLAHTFPMSFYEELVVMGNGMLKGVYMLQGFKSKQYFEKYTELYNNIEDQEY